MEGKLKEANEEVSSLKASLNKMVRRSEDSTVEKRYKDASDILEKKYKADLADLEKQKDQMKLLITEVELEKQELRVQVKTLQK